jgi:cell wall-associated NlpC family hydrolase
MGASPRRWRHAVVAVCAVASCASAAGIGGRAGATPLDDKQAQATKIAKQLDALGDHIEVLDERYNQAVLRRQDAETALASTNADLAARAAELDRAKARLGDVAVASYTHSGVASLVGVLLRGDDVSDVDRRRRYVATALTDQSDAVREVEAAQADLRSAAAEKQVELIAARSAEDDATSSRAQAEHTMATQQTTLAKVQGEMADLVAAAQAKQAADTQAAAEARAAAAATTTTADPTSFPIVTTTTTAATPDPAAPAAVAPSTTSTTLSAPTTTGAPGASATTTTRPASPSLLSTTTTTLKPGGGPLTNPPVSPGAAAAVAQAKAQLGKPYVFGGAGPDSFDCSGLTMYAWASGGRSLPHSASAQYQMLPHVAIANLQPGDLVFFGSDLHHVGIYVGGGQMIEAPHTGANVRYASIYSRTDLVGAGRP